MSTKRGKEEYKGLLFKVDKSKSIIVYVDASFAGEWNKSWSNDPTSVYSRTGFIVTYAGCPILWASKLQSEMSLSTTEAEYIALSHSMRETIPMITLFEESKKYYLLMLKLPNCTVPFLKTTVLVLS